jgi:hypothetical protein
MASAVHVGTPPNSVRPESRIGWLRNPRARAASCSASNSSSPRTCRVILRHDVVTHAAATGSSCTVAVPVAGSSDSVTAVISQAPDACAPCAISLPRRMPRSRRMTITCFTSIALV